MGMATGRLRLSWPFRLLAFVPVDLFFEMEE
jgi:hypothetical protein